MGPGLSFLFEVLKVLLPAALIMLGWIIVHDLSQERDIATARRKALLEQLDLLLKLSEEVLAWVLEYHAKSRDEALERKIVALFSYMGMIVSSLEDLGLDHEAKRALIEAHNGFKRGSTGHHFSDEHDAAWACNSGEIQAIDLLQGVFRSLLVQARIRGLKSAGTMTSRLINRVHPRTPK